ncbi:MAG: hypothetical protein ACREDJ_03295, partial [Methylocella sp.]
MIASGFPGEEDRKTSTPLARSGVCLAGRRGAHAVALWDEGRSDQQVACAVLLRRRRDPRLAAALAVETHENWLEAIPYIDLEPRARAQDRSVAGLGRQTAAERVRARALGGSAPDALAS